MADGAQTVFLGLFEKHENSLDQSYRWQRQRQRGDKGAGIAHL
jgi:hypothetical protein